jgi:hypothetical protein
MRLEKPDAVRKPRTIDCGMDPKLQGMFLREIQTQALACHAAGRDFEAALTKAEVRDIFRHLDAILSHAGRISLILWPTRESNKARGEILRKTIGVPDDDFLSNRSLRNNLAHFDERLEAWFAETGGDMIIDFNVMPTVPVNPKVVLRHFVPGKMIYIFRSEEYDMRSIARSVSAVYTAATQALAAIK